MKSFYLTHSVKSARGSAIVDARAICDQINKSLGDAGRTTEEDARAELENIPADVVALYGIHVESIEVDGE
jgi:hypothetical protein